MYTLLRTVRPNGWGDLQKPVYRSADIEAVKEKLWDEIRGVIFTNGKELIHTPPYDFLWSNPHLGDRIMFLTYGGSHSYGTNVATSDIDIRGCAFNSRSDLIGLTNFEQVVNEATDTTVYGFNKLIGLLLNCNPNTIEMLGCKPDHYFLMTPAGQTLIDNRKLFLSKRAVGSFGGYATQQLRRLENALARDAYPPEVKERHIMGSCNNAMMSFPCRYKTFSPEQIQLHVEDLDGVPAIFADVDMKNIPLRQFISISNELTEVTRHYDKLNHRNSKKDDAHLNKHAMHLIRLYLMCFDILEKGDIITYRETDKDFLLSIRNGKFQNEDHTFRPEFFDLVKEYEKRLEYAKNNTDLPNHPNMKRVEELVMSINEEGLKIK